MAPITYLLVHYDMVYITPRLDIDNVVNQLRTSFEISYEYNKVFIKRLIEIFFHKKLKIVTTCNLPDPRRLWFFFLMPEIYDNDTHNFTNNIYLYITPTR